MRVCMHVQCVVNALQRKQPTLSGYDGHDLHRTAQHVFIDCMTYFSHCQMHLTSLKPHSAQHSSSHRVHSSSAGSICNVFAA
eukprot:12148-Heterococcus_DN1.PRE.3